MATVLTPPVSVSRKSDATLTRELALAAGRIRGRDALVGGLTVGVLALGYLAAVVVLDQAFDLPRWTRQLGLAGFVGAAGVVGYFFVLRPLLRTVNPRYAARQVEATVPDAKNAVINWVDLQDREMPDAVRAAVGAKAAAGVAMADVHKVSESRAVLALGAALGLLIACLGGLFVFLKPAPFMSHVNRAVNPFADLSIASRTTLTITEPVGGDTTVTAGESLGIAVSVGGSVPDADSPRRIRLQFRHTQTAVEYDELPFELGANTREWQLRVPPSVSQNGFWYRVAGGDTVTPEYRVNVRSRPLIREYETTYEYPAYTRLKPETATGPQIEAYRGTRVTLTTRTNRPAARGWIQFDAKETISAEVTGDAKDLLVFRFPLVASGTYQIGFTTADEEVAEPTAKHPIKALVDQAPRPEITVPADDAITIPLNGRLAVDGVVGDDFGIAGVALKLRLLRETPIELVTKKYRDGASLKRDTDGSFPLTLETKDSLPLGGFTTADGKSISLREGDVIEYRLEAIDNCTEPKANVGTSPVKKARLGPAEKVEQAKADDTKRKADEAAHKQKQDQQLRSEKRDPQQPRADQPKEGTEPPAGTQQQGNPGEKAPMPADGGPKPPMPPDAGPKPPEGAPMPTDAGPKPPMTPDAGPKGPPEKTEVDRQAEKVQDALNEQPAAGKPMDPTAGQPSAPTAGTKSTPPDGAEQPETKTGQSPMDKPAASAKPTGSPMPKEGQERPADPMTGDNPNAGKPETPKPTDPATTKPGPDASTKPEAAKPTDPGQAGGAEKPQGANAKPQGGEKPVDPKKNAEAARDLTSDDPAKRQAARDQLDKSVGKETREKYEKIANDLKSDDPAKRKAAEEELGELSREFDRGGLPDPRPGRQEDVERLTRQAEDLASDDAGKRDAAEKEFDKQFGKEKRQDLQNKMKSGDPKQKEDAKKDVDELAKKEKPKPQPTKEEINELAKKAPDLASDDKSKREAAEKEFDQKLGKDGREQVQKAMQDAKAADAKKQQAADQKAADAAKQAGGGMPPSKEEIEKLAEKAKDLNSTDPMKREAAEKEFDQKFGKEAREQLQKDLNDPAKQKEAMEKAAEMAKQAGGGMPPSKEEIEKLAEKAKDLNSTDPMKREAAEKEFDQKFGKEARQQLQKDMNDPAKQKEAMEKAAEMAKQAGGGMPPSKEDLQKLAEKAKDLASDDPMKRAAAEKEFDQKLGKEGREQLQKDMKDLKSDDAKTQQAARDRIEQAAKAAGGEPKPPSKEDIDKLAAKAKDLTSDDPKKRDAAEKAVDQEIGKENRERLQKDLKDAAMEDQKKQQAAQQQLADAAKQAGGTPPSPEEMDKLAEKAKDLTSDDPAKRAAAEKELDDKIGKPAREQAQQTLQDLKSNDAKKQQAARDKIDQAMKNWKPGNGSARGQDAKPFTDDPKNRLKTAELQLQEFEKNRYNEELKKKLGWTDAEMEQFLKSYQDRVAKLRQEVEQPSTDTLPSPTAPTVRVSEGSGNKKLDTRPDGTATGATGSGPGTAPPGFSDAQKKFAEEAAKLRKKDR